MKLFVNLDTKVVFRLINMAKAWLRQNIKDVIDVPADKNLGVALRSQSYDELG